MEMLKSVMIFKFFLFLFLFLFFYSFLLPRELARGSETRIYSHKVRMYVRGGSRSGMSCEMSFITYVHPTQGHRYRPYVRHTV